MRTSALMWFIDRWRKSTAFTDMELEAQGAYRNLIDEAALRGGELPVDERILAKASGDATAWPRVRVVVLARFQVVAGVYRNETLDAVLGEMARRRGKQQAYRDRLRDQEGDDGNGAGNEPGNGDGNAAGNGTGNESGNAAGVLVLGTTRAQVQQERTARSRESRPRRSEWARACAIAHNAIEKHPKDFTDQAHFFRERCEEQGIDWTFKRDGRELVHRALDFVTKQRSMRDRRS